MKKEEQAPGTERVTIAVTLDFAGFASAPGPARWASQAFRTNRSRRTPNAFRSP